MNDYPPFEKILYATVAYKNHKCRVVAIPDKATGNDFFRLLPYRANVDIGTGPGMPINLPVDQFKNEVEIKFINPTRDASIDIFINHLLTKK